MNTRDFNPYLVVKSGAGYRTMEIRSGSTVGPTFAEPQIALAYAEAKHRLDVGREAFLAIIPAEELVAQRLRDVSDAIRFADDEDEGTGGYMLAARRAQLLLDDVASLVQTLNDLARCEAMYGKPTWPHEVPPAMLAGASQLHVAGMDELPNDAS